MTLDQASIAVHEWAMGKPQIHTLGAVCMSEVFH